MCYSVPNLEGFITKVMTKAKTCNSESRPLWCPSLKLFKVDKDILEHPWHIDDSLMI